MPKIEIILTFFFMTFNQLNALPTLRVNSKTENSVDTNYICRGEDDDQVIQAALDELKNTGGGKILLSKGTFLLVLLFPYKSSYFI